MKISTIRTTCAMILLLTVSAGSAWATGLPECTTQQLMAYRPDEAKVQTHRTFTLPALTYASGTKKTGTFWGLELSLRVEPDGKVTCWKLTTQWSQQDALLNRQRRALLARLSSWRYRPFTRHHKPVVAIVTERIAEQAQPGSSAQPPDVPLDQVHIRLRRTSCYGTCPDYSVDVHGDGKVVFNGHRFVDINGRHTYRIPKQDVAKLVADLRALNIWSMRPVYRAPITDNPSFVIEISFGKQTHRIIDYVGQMVGMPAAVSHFEDEIDRVSRAGQWVHLSPFAIERLKSEGFDFHSQAGADLLARAITNFDSRDETAMITLIRLGSPVHGGKGAWHTGITNLTARAAVMGRSPALIDALIKAGGLSKAGHPDPDQGMIDAAFQAAILGGRMDLVARLWMIHSQQPHPSLTYLDRSTGYDPGQHVPVTLLLDKGLDPDRPWDGPAIARWLIAKGCDLRARGADGRTLLQIAAEAGDAGMLRYLLAQGADPSAPTENGVPALAHAYSGDAALVLLQAGTNLKLMPGHGAQLLKDARKYHWPRVVDWMNAHPAASAFSATPRQNLPDSE